MFTTSAEVLDMLAQILNKTWGGPTLAGELLAVIDELLVVQGCLCSSGIERGPIHPTVRARQVRAWRDQERAAK
jgi:hypothetical protein